jgi:hypothetical protein
MPNSHEPLDERKSLYAQTGLIRTGETHTAES